MPVHVVKSNGKTPSRSCPVLNLPLSLVDAQEQDSGGSHGYREAAGMLKGHVKMSAPGGSEKNSKTPTRSIGRVWKESLKPYYGSQEGGIGRGHRGALIFYFVHFHIASI